MTGKSKKERAALNRLNETLVDDILTASDEAILAEFKETHGDPIENATNLRALFEKSVVAMNKQRLADAKAGVATARRSSLPSSAQQIDIAEARRKLRRVLDHPNGDQPLTIAARKETELSDADVLSMLKDFEELGIITPDENDGKG
jgi:hypothetical protein